MSKETEQAKAELAVILARKYPKKRPTEIATFLQTVQATGRTLHKRYENMCNHVWATGENYEEVTSKHEQKLIDYMTGFLGVGRFPSFESPKDGVSLQRDPRGWPVIIILDGSQHRLGGR